VFLDEIGELDAGIQVKLLRVLQSREFQRVGETNSRSFRGKIVAATNRNLANEIEQKRFRDDLYFRLCADIVHTPTLREQLSESPGDVVTLLSFLTRRIIPDDSTESSALATEVQQWIEENMPPGYGWPGNIRELEQCARNVMIRGCYHPSTERRDAEPTLRDKLASQVVTGELKIDELLRHYTSLAFAMDGSYVAAAERLGVNWRTVREKMDSALVAEYGKN
jgi:DNA-binding NtrC family response regulator